MPKKTLKNVTVAEAYMALLADRNVEYFFANAGTDFAPIVEALAKGQALGGDIPTPVTCPHENTAAHMAIGYYLATGRPQVAMVHVNVGTANMLNGMLNACRGNIPVLFTAGRTPTNEDTLRGHRSLDIHWTQEMFDQAGMVREAVKWDYELRNPEQLETVVDRALTIAMSEPRGPVYLSLPREVLSAQLESFTYDSPSRQRAAEPPYANGNAVDEVAALLAKAENPLIITANAGRNSAAWHALSDLAERYAIPVVQYRNRYLSIPSHHPMNMGYDLSPLFENADVVLAVDSPVPWLPAVTQPKDDAKIIHMGADPLHSYVPVRGHPCDYGLACSTEAGLNQLNEAMEEHEKSAQGRIGKRRAALAVRHKELRDGWAQALAKAKDQTPVHPAWITHCIDQIKDSDTLVIKESGLQQQFIDITEPMTMVNAGAASGLGWGMGCALGMKLANPDRLVIDTEGDGAYMFSNPVSAHYVAAEQELPLLTVIFNNQRWQAVRRATLALTPDGYAAKSNRPPITLLDGMSNYEKVVEVAGGHGERVTDSAEVLPALERAMKAVTVEKRQALVNVICSA